MLKPYICLSFLFVLLNIFGCLGQSNVETIAWRDFKGDTINDIYGVGIRKYYSSNNRLDRVVYLDKDGGTVELTGTLLFFPHEFRYEYDSKGNYTKKTAYNSEGQIMNLGGTYESAITEYTYNESNQLIEKRHLNKDGRLLQSDMMKDIITKYGYNEIGKVARFKIYESPYYLSSHITYEYDDEGRLKAERYYNSDNKLKFEVLIDYNNNIKTVEKSSGKGDKIWTSQWYYEKDILTKTYSINHQDSAETTNERILSFEVKGWKVSRKTKPFKFKYTGSGEFTIKVKRNGKISDVIVKSNRVNGSMAFIQEVNRYLRKVRLKKTASKANRAIEGVFKIRVLAEYPMISYLESIPHPKP